MTGQTRAHGEFGEIVAEPRAARGRVGSGRAFFPIKRVIDIVGSGLLLLLLSPLLAIICLAIKLDSPGPVLFIQKRMGAKRLGSPNASWQTQPFEIFKFRSMYHESDESLHQEYIKEFVTGSVEASADGAKFKLNGDSRITRVGRVIRRASIDELPQLLNVLRGEMSLVGPRPVPQYEVDGYLPWHMERLDALPGMTGYWQVYGRGRVTFEEMMRMDIKYVRSQSIWLDLKLLMLTIPAVLRGSGAE